MNSRKKKLHELLKEMDNYDWGKVPDISDKFKDYRKFAEEAFKEYLKKAGIKLSGLVLDLCCGPVSFGVVYKNVIGYDIIPEFIKELRKNGIKGIIGDIRELPFEDKTFDYVICCGLPLRPYKKVKCGDGFKYVPEDVNVKSYIENFVDDCIRIAKKKVLIISVPLVRYLPEKHRDKIEKVTYQYVLYNKNKFFVLKNRLSKKRRKRIEEMIEKSR